MQPTTLGAHAGRAAVTAIVSVALGLALTACEGGSRTTPRGGDLDAPATTLVVSAEYARSAAGADAAARQQRLADLQAGIDELRTATGSGWTGRQDDVTGYLGELSGGRWSTSAGSAGDEAGGGDERLRTVAAFFAERGAQLFGVDETQVRTETAPSVSGTLTVRGNQEVGSVPVLDAALTLTTTADASGTRLNAVRGRVFPGLDVDTRPTITPAEARATTRRLSGVGTQGTPRLVIVPDGAGVLTWEVRAIGLAADASATQIAEGTYYIDAHTGELETVRAASAHSEVAYTGGLEAHRTPSGLRLRPLPRRLATALRGVADGDTVQVSAVNDVVGPITANATQTRQGVRLIDTTVPSYDPKTGQGGLETFSMSGLGENDADLPGRPYIAGGDLIDDGDAVAAQNYARAVYDYYGSLGRFSWDGQGGSLLSAVHYGAPSYCNAFFLDVQMVYGNTCTIDGEPQSTGAFSIDTAGHEITHGVTKTSAGLIYSGQSGALNESFSDYFGNIIGNRYNDDDSDAYSEHRCAGITQPTILCLPNPDGTSSVRFLPNGTTFADYVRVIEPGPHAFLVGLDNQDNGGVHNNSAVWNNALWTIRKRLAQIDGVAGNDSELADQFDHIVFHALTQKLFPSAGFLDARSAIEETITEAGASPEVGVVAAEVFDSLQICEGCGVPEGLPGQAVALAGTGDRTPVVSGERVAWLSFETGADALAGTVVGSDVGGTATAYQGLGPAISAAFAGDALLTIGRDGVITWTTPDGQVSSLGRVAANDAVVAGLAGSDDGAAFVDGEDLVYVTPDGAITRTSLRPLRGAQVHAVGVGGGTVAVGAEDANLFRWVPGSGKLQPVGNMTTNVVSVAAFGDDLVAVDAAGVVATFDSEGFAQLSDSALPYGVAINGEYAVWSEALGPLPGRANEGGYYPDADLYGYSLSTGTTFSVMEVPGQQAAPALSGNRLVWQDAVLGGDDVFTATLPSGL